MKKFNIYSGFVEYPIDPQKYANLSAQDFFIIWAKNTTKFSPENTQIKIFGPHVPHGTYSNVEYIAQYNNLGHVFDYMERKKTGRWCGWTAGIIFGMVHAYLHEADFIYKEQDCLWFGDCINLMYSEIGDGNIILGKNQQMTVGQSLFLVPRNSIPIVIGSLSKFDDKDIFPEKKFLEIPGKKFYSMGYDRDRPFDINKTPFHIQQISPEDLQKIQHLL